jgi:hypothetical protein
MEAQEQNGATVSGRIEQALILFSLAILCVAIIWTWRIGKEANNINHRLHHMTEDLEGLRADVEKMEAQLR